LIDFGVFRAQGTCPVAANVILPVGKLTAVLQISYLSFRANLQWAKERKRERRKLASCLINA